MTKSIFLSIVLIFSDSNKIVSAFKFGTKEIIPNKIIYNVKYESILLDHAQTACSGDSLFP